MGRCLCISSSTRNVYMMQEMHSDSVTVLQNASTGCAAWRFSVDYQELCLVVPPVGVRTNGTICMRRIWMT